MESYQTQFSMLMSRALMNSHTSPPTKNVTESTKGYHSVNPYRVWTWLVVPCPGGALLSIPSRFSFAIVLHPQPRNPERQWLKLRRSPSRSKNSCDPQASQRPGGVCWTRGDRTVPSCSPLSRGKCAKSNRNLRGRCGHRSCRLEAGINALWPTVKMERVTEA